MSTQEKNGKGENVQNSAKTTKIPGGVTGKGFKPGESGNPGGRPKKLPITEVLQELFGEANKPFILKELRKVMSGKSGMAKVLLTKDAAERLEGKVTLPVQVDGELKVTLSEAIQKARQRAAKK